MKKNLLKIYESFFDDLDKLNQDKVNDEFGAVNRDIYDQHNYILSLDKNPKFFEALYKFCKDYFPNLPSNENGFKQEDLDKITYLDTVFHTGYSYFKNVVSLDELKYFHNLWKINDYSFYNCRDLKSVIFPKNLQIIHPYSFTECSSLKEVIFNENIIKIGNCSFQDCYSVKKIVIPEKFKYKLNNIFYGIYLKKINITYI